MSLSAFRFAPSPNGELHLGHAYSALLNAQMAGERGGRFLIRIEDIDTVRCTAALTARALADLDWLGLAWEEPVRVQSRHLKDYAAAEERLRTMGLLYPCFCSRKDIAALGASGPRDPEGQPLYPGTCRRLSPSEIADRMAGGIPYAMRLDMRLAQSRLAAPLTHEEKGKAVAADPLRWGDAVLVRKDIGTSYHIAVVTDDALQGISHVVRGRDLHAATAIHRLLQELLGLPAPSYHHHELIGDETGRKLSKSAGDISLRTLREQGVSAEGIRRALGFAYESHLDVKAHDHHHMGRANGCEQGELRPMNTMRTGLLLAAMTGLFLAVGFLLGGQTGMVMAFVVAAAMNLFAYWNADKMVLRMHGARLVDRAGAPEFHDLVAELAQRASLPMPKLYIMDNPQPNAFATGRNPENAAVAATTGLLKLLNRDEIAGVMAHELAHIRNRDTLVMTVTATIAGAVSMLANFGFFFGGRDRNSPLGPLGSILILILAPLAAMIVQMAVSRTREYAADRGGAEISGRPLALASALAKISGAAHRIENHSAEANPATAHLFIINPLSGRRMDNLFTTHPATENRIAALEAMAREMTSPQATSGPWSAGQARRSRPWG